MGQWAALLACATYQGCPAQPQPEQHQGTKAQVIMHKACFAGFTEKHLKGNSQVTTGFSIPLQESQPYNFCN